MVIANDENKKKRLKHLTILEYKMSFAYVVIAVVVFAAGMFISFHTGRYINHKNYSKGYIILEDNLLTKLDLWLTFTNFSFLIFAASFAAVLYCIYEMKKYYLCDKTNLNAKDSHLLIVKDSLLYISTHGNGFDNKKDIVYMPFKDINFVLYDKNFKRLEFYGMFYKDRMDGSSYVNEPVLMGSMLLYDCYSKSLVGILAQRGVEVRAKDGFLVDKWDVSGERIIEAEERGRVKEEIESYFSKTESFSLAEYIDELFAYEGGRIAFVEGDTNLIDRKNYGKYYLILFAMAMTAVLNIVLEYMYGGRWDFGFKVKFYERIIVAVLMVIGIFRGYNGYDIDIVKKGCMVKIEEISRIYGREIKHVFEFRLDDIKEMEYRYFRGLTIRVNGDYTCYDNLETVDRLGLRGYSIKFFVKRSVAREFERAVRLNKDCFLRIRESGIKRGVAWYDWRG